jgi:drug/metabolite transporter (DMT)-like permease
MHWIVFAIAAALAWGSYGPVLQQGQASLASPFRALLCVGLAYMAIGVVLPVIVLAWQGELGSRGWNMSGFMSATSGGALGAIGAVFLIYAFRAGGLPTYVMPIVFGGAPVVNVLFSMYLHPPKTMPNPLMWVGMVLVAGGASLVLYFRPHA